MPAPVAKLLLKLTKQARSDPPGVYLSSIPASTSWSRSSAKATDRAAARVLERARDALDFEASDGHDRAKSLDDAFHLLRELMLRQDNAVYLPGLFNVLVLGCARNGQMERALDTLRLCRLSGVAVSARVREQVYRLRVLGGAGPSTGAASRTMNHFF